MEALTQKEIESKENLKKMTVKELQAVTEVLNKNWFPDPVSSKKKLVLATAIGGCAVWDSNFTKKFFKDNPDAELSDFDTHIQEIEEFNDSLGDEEYDEKSKEGLMISPAEIEKGEENGLSNDILKIILKLTGVNYLTLYGFDDELTEKTEKTEKTEDPPAEKTEEKTETEKKPEKEEKKKKTKAEIEEEIEIEKAEHESSLGLNTTKLGLAIEKVAPGLGKEECENLIRFENDYLRTYSANVSVFHPFDSGITGNVSGKELQAFVKKIGYQEIELIQKEDKVQITGDSLNAEFNFNELIMPTVDLPISTDEWIDIPADFAEVVHFASMSASTKAPKAIYNCVVINGDKVIACENGHKGTEVVMHGEFAGKMNLYAKSAKELVKYEPVFMCDKGMYFHFKNHQGTIISLRKYAEGEFVQAFFDNLKLQGIEIEIPSGLKKIVEACLVFSGKGFRDYVTVSISSGVMNVSAVSDSGKFKDKVLITNQEVEAEFAIHPALFKEILSSSTTLEICERFILFRGPDLTSWISKVIPNN